MVEKLKEEFEVKEQEPKQRLETIIYFIRHGTAEDETPNLPPVEANIARRLTKEGIQEAQETGKRIKEELGLKRGDIVFFRYSPAARARQTVEIVRAELLEDTDAQYQISRKPEKEELYFSEPVDIAYRAGKERRGTPKDLAEEWIRNPELFQKDIEAAGLLDVTAKDLLEEREVNFRKHLSVYERASRILRKKWESHLAKEGTKNETPPRLIILLGSHATIVSEVWLGKLLKDYKQKIGERIPLELKKGGYFSIHIPSRSDIPPVLRISGREIPVPEEALKMKDL